MNNSQTISLLKQIESDQDTGNASLSVMENKLTLIDVDLGYIRNDIASIKIPVQNDFINDLSSVVANTSYLSGIDSDTNNMKTSLNTIESDIDTIKTTLDINDIFSLQSYYQVLQWDGLTNSLAF
jgi:hypothetical protein